jgi:hypothetical protein
MSRYVLLLATLVPSGALSEVSGTNGTSERHEGHRTVLFTRKCKMMAVSLAAATHEASRNVKIQDLTPRPDPRLSLGRLLTPHRTPCYPPPYRHCGGVKKLHLDKGFSEAYCRFSIFRNDQEELCHFGRSRGWRCCPSWLVLITQPGILKLPQEIAERHARIRA